MKLNKTEKWNLRALYELKRGKFTDKQVDSKVDEMRVTIWKRIFFILKYPFPGRSMRDTTEKEVKMLKEGGFYE